MNSIFLRRSIRRYLETPVEPEKIDRILRAAMQAPSAKNHQPWHFLVLTEEKDRQAVSEMSEFAGMCRFAPLVVVTLADLREYEGSAGDWWVQDMSACTENLLLQAVEEGLGGCWLGFYPYAYRTDRVKEYFSLPEYMQPFSVVSLGYSEKENKFVDRYDASRVHYNGW